MILHFETHYSTSPMLEEKRIDIVEFIKYHVQEIDQNILQVILQNIKDSGVATLVRNYQFKIVGVALLCKEKISKVTTQDILEIIAIHKDFRNSGIGRQLLEKLRIGNPNDIQFRDYNLANTYFTKHGLQIAK